MRAHHGGPALKLVAATEKDPRFKKAIDRLNYNAHKEKQHPPSKKEADAAEAAAKAPPNEQLAGAQANKVNAMEEAKPGKKPEPKSFLEMLRAEIQKVMPKKTEDAGDFMKGDDRQQLKSAMTGNVQEQKSKTSEAIDSANQNPSTPTPSRNRRIRRSHPYLHPPCRRRSGLLGPCRNAGPKPT